MPKDTYIEMVFKSYFSLVNNRLEAAQNALKDTKQIPEPAQPKKRRVPVAPLQQQTPFGGGM